MVDLMYLVRGLVPPELLVFVASFDVRLTSKTSLPPDVLVARRSDVTEENLPVPPLPAVEVRSPSTRHVDLGLRRSTDASAGTPCCWVVDPDVPSVTAGEVVDGRCADVGHAEGDELLAFERPFPVRIVAAQLVP